MSTEAGDVELAVIDRYRYLTAGSAKSGPFDLNLGLHRADHATLAAMPLSFACAASLVLDAANALGGQHQDVLIELA